jgi:mono/diheme cytochrome c family protein
MQGRTGRAAAFAALAIAVTAIAAVRPAAAQQATSEQANADAAYLDQTRIDLGKAIYAEKCSHCHGPGMLNAGTITPDLRRFPDDRQRFATTIKQGKNNRMPPWGDILNDDDIAELWAYVSSRRSP